VSEITTEETSTPPEGIQVTANLYVPNSVIAALDLKKFTREKFINGRGVKLTIADVSQMLLDDHGIPVKSEDRYYLQQALLTHMNSQKKKKHLNSMGAPNELYSLIQRAIPITDMVGGNVYFIDSVTSELVDMDEDVFMAVNDMTPGNRTELINASQVAYVEFNPNSKNKVYSKQSHGVEARVVNLYDEPSWMAYSPTENKIPELIEALFTNAFPNSLDREYVYKWFYRSVCATKNETILCLIGSQGIGKDFIVNLLAHGVGTKFYQKADQSILADKFNSQVKYCRLLFLDETKVSNVVEENKLKGLTSTNISYQAKGTDATTIESFINIVVANNNKDALPVKPGDRRYSIPELGTKRLEAYFEERFGKEGKEKIGELSSYIYKGVKDDQGNKKEKPHQDIINFFHWLKNRYEGDKSALDGNTPFQGKYYHDLVIYNMAEWQKRIYEYISDHRKFPVAYLKDIKKGMDEQASKTFPSSSKTIEKFLSLYPHEGKFDMATFETLSGERGSRVFALTDEYIKYLHPLDYWEKIEARDRVLAGGPMELPDKLDLCSTQVSL